MGFGGGGSAPAAPVIPPPVAPPPTPVDPAVIAAGQAARARAVASLGLGGTIFTGPQGLVDKSSTAPKNLTGQ